MDLFTREKLTGVITDKLIGWRSCDLEIMWSALTGVTTNNYYNNNYIYDYHVSRALATLQ